MSVESLRRLCQTDDRSSDGARLRSPGQGDSEQNSAETETAQRLTGHGAADAVDDNIDAPAGRYPADATGETFRGQVNHIFEAKLARTHGFDCAAGRRNDPAGALCPRRRAQ